MNRGMEGKANSHTTSRGRTSRNFLNKLFRRKETKKENEERVDDVLMSNKKEKKKSLFSWRRRKSTKTLEHMSTTEIHEIHQKLFRQIDWTDSQGTTNRRRRSSLLSPWDIAVAVDTNSTVSGEGGSFLQPVEPSELRSGRDFDSFNAEAEKEGLETLVLVQKPVKRRADVASDEGREVDLGESASCLLEVRADEVEELLSLPLSNLTTPHLKILFLSHSSLSKAGNSTKTKKDKPNRELVSQRSVESKQRTKLQKVCLKTTDPSKPSKLPILEALRLTLLLSEILLQIVEFCSISSAATLAMCSKQLYFKLGTKIFPHPKQVRLPVYHEPPSKLELRKQTPDQGEKIRFLKYLARDSMEIIFCQYCKLLHKPSKRMIGKIHKLSLPFFPRGVKFPRPCEVAVNRSSLPQYMPIEFNWSIVNFIIKHHHHGGYDATTTKLLSRLSTNVTTYEAEYAIQRHYEFKISPKGHLIARSQHWVLPQAPASELVSRLDYETILLDLKLSICPHLKLENTTFLPKILEELLECELNHMLSSQENSCAFCTGLRQCNYCTTEYQCDAQWLTRDKLAICYTAWQDFGPGRSPFSAYWQNLTIFQLSFPAPKRVKFVPGSIKEGFESFKGCGEQMDDEDTRLARLMEGYERNEMMITTDDPFRIQNPNSNLKLTAVAPGWPALISKQLLVLLLIVLAGLALYLSTSMKTFLEI